MLPALRKCASNAELRGKVEIDDRLKRTGSLGICMANAQKQNAKPEATSSPSVRLRLACLHICLTRAGAVTGVVDISAATKPSEPDALSVSCIFPTLLWTIEQLKLN